MMRYLALLLSVCLFAVAALAQDEEPPFIIEEAEDPDPLFGRFMLDAGITKMRPWQLNDALFGTHQFDQFNTVGFSLGSADETHPQSDDIIVGLDLTYGFHVYLANEARITDSSGSVMNYRLKGWEIMTSTMSLNLIRNEHVDFVCGIGVYWGNLKLRTYNLTTHTGDGLYKNPFVAPMLRTELRFNFWRLTFGTRVSYRYDITRDNWKRKDDGLDPLPGYSFREMQFMIYLGLRDSGT